MSVGVSPPCHHPSGLHRRLAPLSFLLGIFLLPSVLAQSAANFNTQSLTPEASAPKESKALLPLSAKPSRQVGPTELAPYLESISSLLLIRERATDPFGQIQDPNAKPVIKPALLGATKRVISAQASPFSDVVKVIAVTTIMPAEKRFLIGSRSIRQGDQIPFTYRGKPIRVQVTEVTSRQITFRNLETGETASRKLDMLPPGVTLGKHGSIPPGMVPDRPNAPIELEAGNPGQ